MKPTNLDQYVNNKGLRATYKLYKCPQTLENHLWQMEPPEGKRKMTLAQYYHLSLDARFQKKRWGKRVPLIWECVGCHKIMITNPYICKKCGRAIKPLSHKMEKHSIMYVRIKCHCK